MSEPKLHMLQLGLYGRRLVDLCKMLHLPLRHVDINYLVHCALGELFQDQSPSLFCVVGDHSMERPTEQIQVLAYSDYPLETLHELASGFASPKLYATCDWERSACKPMPSHFPQGMRFRFELRACPVVRLSSPVGKFKRGNELDAFLARGLRNPDETFERETVYREWLQGHLERRGGATLQRCTMERFSLEKMVRRTHGSSRKTKTLTRPDVTLKGELEVEESEAFAELLRRGVGRSRAFGFGMFKLRRSS